AHRLLVVDDEDAARVGHRRAHEAAPIGAATSTTSGRYTVNALPPPGSESTAIQPPCSRTMLQVTDRPRPVPSPTALVVKNGSNTRLRVVSSMPWPVSRTVSVVQRARSPPTSAGGVTSLLPTVTSTTPPAGVAWMPLTTRLMITCWNWLRSTEMLG